MITQPWHVTLLGGLRAEQAGRSLTRFKTQKVAALLAYLAFHLPRTHSREFLIDLLWPDGTTEAGRNSLSVALSSLRAQLEPPGTPAHAVLRADRFSVGLSPAALTTDVQQFEAALRDAARAGSALERSQALERAVGLYAGPLLPQSYDEWVVPEQERLAGLFFDAAGRLIALREQSGDLPGALSLARRAVSADPLREEASEALMRLLASSGQPGAALRHYKELERRLGDELGEEPSAPLRALARQVERQSGLTAPPAPAPAIAPAPPAIVPTAPAASTNEPPLPETLTFLLTDIEGSTRQWERAGEAFRGVLEEHHRLLRAEFARFGGREAGESSGGFEVAFGSARKALACAVACQRALAGHAWPAGVEAPAVRMAVHTGDLEVRDGAYRGPVLHQASRMLTAAQGGQVLVSEATAGLVGREPGGEVRLTDLGVYRLRDLPAPARLFQAEWPGMARAEFGPLDAEAGLSAGLPLTFTRFFGREREIALVRERVLDPGVRLLTVTGPGGTGKTRLALESAQRLVSDFAGAVWFAQLADLSDPARIADAVLDALRLLPAPQREPLEQAAEFLSRQPSLLVLDNFEHLVEGGAAVVRALLDRVPGLTVLVTSRQVLGLAGERQMTLSPLPTPNGPDTPERLSLFDSVQLFVDRAQAALPDFQVTGHNAAAVAELCDRLEGIPLAIELAAARAQVLTPMQMLAQLSDRFAFLSSRRRDLGERQRTLRGAVEWSHRLLSPELQRLFARLSVFRGGWTLEAAESVCEEPLALDHLAQLRDASLVTSEETAFGMRFSMLETLREYGQQELGGRGETAAVRARHRDFFLALAGEAREELNGPQQAAWLSRLEAEHDNFQAALAWCQHDPGGAEAGLRLAAALNKFWQVRGHYSLARRLTAAALSRPTAREHWRPRAAALSGAGTLARVQADYDVARALFEEELLLCREAGYPAGVADALSGLGVTAWARGDYPAARAYHEESLATFRDLGDRAATASALNNLGLVVFAQGDYERARALYEEGLALQRVMGSRLRVANLLLNLGNIAVAQGDYPAARAYHEESLAIYRELEEKDGIAVMLHSLGLIAYGTGEYASARARFEESLAIARELGHRMLVANVLTSLAGTAVAAGDAEAADAFGREALALVGEAGIWPVLPYALHTAARIAHVRGLDLRAACLLGAVESACDGLGAPLDPVARERFDRNVAEVRHSLGEAFDAAWAAGRALGLENALAYALEAGPG